MKTMVTIEMKRVNSANVYDVVTPSSILKRMQAALLQSKFAIVLASIVSLMLCQKVSTTKSLHLLNASTAGMCAFLFGGFSFLAQVMLLVWFGVAVWQFAKSK